MEMTQISDAAVSLRKEQYGMTDCNELMNAGLSFMDLIQQLLCSDSSDEDSELTGEFANMINFAGAEPFIINESLSNSLNSDSMLNACSVINTDEQLNNNIINNNGNVIIDAAGQLLDNKSIIPENKDLTVKTDNLQKSESLKADQGEPENFINKFVNKQEETSQIQQDERPIVHSYNTDKDLNVNDDLKFIRNIYETKLNISENKNKSKNETDNALDVDSLQKQADNFDIKTLMISNSKEINKADTPAKQIFDSINQNINEGKNEFTVKLKPEGLGEVIVKLYQQEGKTMVSLMASSVKTADLLNSNLSSLQTALSQHNVQLADNAEVIKQTFSMSSGSSEHNYYGGNSNPENSNPNNYNRGSNYYDGFIGNDDSLISDELLHETILSAGGLNMFI